MRLLSLALAMSVLAPLQVTRAQQESPVEYQIEDLGSVDGRGLTVANAINDFGEVVGWGLADSGTGVPVYWSRHTGFIKIVDLQGEAFDINDKGQVIGWFVRDFALVGFLWSREHGVTELGTLQPISINNRGDIVGPCVSGGGVPCLVSSGVVRELEVPAGASAFATSINDRGDIVGTVNFGPSDNAAIWRRHESGLEVLEPRAAAGYDHVIAREINDRRIIIGNLETLGATARYPVIWDRDGAPIVVDSMQGQATDINNHGVAIVWGEAPLNGLAWDTKHGTVSILPSLGGIDPPFPNDINNRGQIVGVSSDANGENHAVLWERVRK
jgi:uncharacterized membrane protein